jgi:hypothetical protein
MYRARLQEIGTGVWVKVGGIGVTVFVIVAVAVSAGIVDVKV